MSHSTAIIAESSRRFDVAAELSARETAFTVMSEGERQAAFRLLPTSPSLSPVGTLPLLATAGDVREAVRFLKKRPAGVGVIEAQGALKKPIFDARKLAAYESWGFVTRDSGRLRLSDLGRELARVLEPSAEIFRRVLREVGAYHAALEWIIAQASEIVTHTDVIAFWQTHRPEDIAPGEENAEAKVVSFFHLCQAAELGWLTIGKRGQPTRLRVEREELAAYLTPGEHSGEGATREGGGRASPFAFSERGELGADRQQVRDEVRPPRVYVSGGRGAKFSRQLRDALALAGIESEAGDVAEDDSAPRTRVSEAMRRCEAGVFVITAADCSGAAADNCGSFDDTLLMEISAAFVLYDRRVILLCETGVEVPPQFRDLRRVELRGEELTWEAGVQLLKALKG